MIDATWKADLYKRDLISLIDSCFPELIKIITVEAEAKHVEKEKRHAAEAKHIENENIASTSKTSPPTFLFSSPLSRAAQDDIAEKLSRERSHLHGPETL
jgi:hypothetical protein